MTFSAASAIAWLRTRLPVESLAILQRLQDRDAVVQQRAEDAREARQGEVQVDIADHRQPQAQPVEPQRGRSELVSCQQPNTMAADNERGSTTSS